MRTSTNGARLQVSPEVGTWLARRSSKAGDWTAEDLVAAKRGTTVSVVIPARNEEATVAQDAVFPALEGLQGKGEALWKGVAATTGDLVVFVDGDLYDFTTSYVTGLLGPLLTDPSVAYVKGFYHRPLNGAAGSEPEGGGRVTELVARPLLNMFWPELAGFVQPLAGEYAGRREVLESIPFVVNYGVEIGHLIDLVELRGLDALAQVDLGHRVHRHQSTQALGRMSGQIMQTLFDRLERYDRLVTAIPPATMLAQFQRGASADGVERELVLTDLTSPQRPPLESLPASIRPENALQETA
jgi:glucosyl-3-phosphoglycerate synthase